MEQNYITLNNGTKIPQFGDYSGAFKPADIAVVGRFTGNMASLCMAATAVFLVIAVLILKPSEKEA